MKTPLLTPRWGAADAEIMAYPGGSPERFPRFKPGIGQNIALHGLPAARDLPTCAT